MGWRRWANPFGTSDPIANLLPSPQEIVAAYAAQKEMAAQPATPAQNGVENGAEENEKKRRRRPGRQSTIFTSNLGDTSAATTTRATLLGD